MRGHVRPHRTNPFVPPTGRGRGTRRRRRRDVYTASHPGRRRRRRRRTHSHIVHVVVRAHTLQSSPSRRRRRRCRRRESSSASRRLLFQNITIIIIIRLLRITTLCTLSFRFRVLCAGGMVLGGDTVVGELGAAAAATKLDPSNIGLFSALRPAMDLSTAAYRYNQNMMEYYTCEYSIRRFEKPYGLRSL